jgi:hypothetical protein
MKKVLMVLILGLVFTAAYAKMDNPLKQGMPNTVTLPNGEVIYDLSGEWDGISEIKKSKYFHKDIIKITQKGNEFVGIRLIGSDWVPKGSEGIKGELEKNGFKSLSVSTFYGWILATGKIGEKCIKIEIQTTLPQGEGNILETTLTRK